MITIRRANPGDYQAIDRILLELDIGHPSIASADFWAAEIDGKIVAVTNIKDCGKSVYMSAVGVTGSVQGRGVASELIAGLLKDATARSVYLYTGRPDFFGRFGFKPADPPVEIPPHLIYGDDACDGINECICMVRARGVS